MADAYIFDDLIGAIQNSFVRANVMLQDQHVQMIYAAGSNPGGCAYSEADGFAEPVFVRIAERQNHRAGKRV